MCHHDYRGVENLSEAIADAEPPTAPDDNEEVARIEPDDDERLPPIQPSD